MNNASWLKSLLFTFFLALFLVMSFSTVYAIAQCGNQMLDMGEECDDNNMAPGDGCSDTCMVEPGYFCDNSELPRAPSMCMLGCNITIIKDAIPAYGTEFDFKRATLSLLHGDTFEPFNLMDPGNPHTFLVPPLSFSYIAEEPPPGWKVDGIVCTPSEVVGDGTFIPGEVPMELGGIDLGNIVLALCLIAGDGTCTYTNVPIVDEDVNLTVAEQANLVPVSVDTATNSFLDAEFPFSITAGELDNNFSLMNTESETMENTPISTIYTITQHTPEGWILDAVVCEGDADFNAIIIDNVAEVELLSPGDLTCTFFNTFVVVRNVPTMSEWGLFITVVLMAMAGVLVYRRKYRQSV